MEQMSLAKFRENYFLTKAFYPAEGQEFIKRLIRNTWLIFQWQMQ